jgi:hypothetical protein
LQTDYTPTPQQALERELAIDLARGDLECYAAQAATPTGQMPRYHTQTLNPERARWQDQDDMARSLQRAVLFLDTIGALDHPVAGSPHIVSIKRALHEQLEAQVQWDGAVTA